MWMEASALSCVHSPSMMNEGRSNTYVRNNDAYNASWELIYVSFLRRNNSQKYIFIVNPLMPILGQRHEIVTSDNRSNQDTISLTSLYSIYLGGQEIGLYIQCVWEKMLNFSYSITILYHACKKYIFWELCSHTNVHLDLMPRR